MTFDHQATGELLRLLRDVRRDRDALVAHEKNLAQLSRAPASDTSGPVDAAIALGLHHYYSAVETALSRICRTLEGDLPQGPDWHVALINNAAQPLFPLRPALLSPETLDGLSELRRFRHFLRNAYAVSLSRGKLLRLCRILADLHPTLVEDMERAVAFVESVRDAAQAP